MKIVHIEICDMCPYFDRIHNSCICIKTGNDLKANCNHIHPIPSDCPLEDVKE